MFVLSIKVFSQFDLTTILNPQQTYFFNSIKTSKSICEKRTLLIKFPAMFKDQKRHNNNISSTTFTALKLNKNRILVTPFFFFFFFFFPPFLSSFFFSSFKKRGGMVDRVRFLAPSPFTLFSSLKVNPRDYLFF